MVKVSDWDDAKLKRIRWGLSLRKRDKQMPPLSESQVRTLWEIEKEITKRALDAGRIND